MSRAIEITLYDRDDKPSKTYTRDIIPWGIMKKAVQLMKSVTESEPENTSGKKKWGIFPMPVTEKKTTEEVQMDAISQFVVELFGNQFTIKELENGADMGEIMSVFQSVLTRANNAVKANPIMSQSPKKP